MFHEDLDCVQVTSLTGKHQSCISSVLKDIESIKGNVQCVRNVAKDRKTKGMVYNKAHIHL